MNEQYKLIESTVRATFGGVVWSHKIQEKQADLDSSQFKHMEIAKIFAASITSVGIISLLFVDQAWVKIASAIVSFVPIFVSAFYKSFDLQTMFGQHKSTANKLLGIREELKVLIIKILLEQESPEKLIEVYEGILSRLNEVYADAPNTTDRAVALARTALNVTKDNTFTDEEIDSFLPGELRRENRCH